MRPEELRVNLRCVFDDFDNDGSGTIHRSSKPSSQQPLSISDAEAARLVEAADTDGSADRSRSLIFWKKSLRKDRWNARHRHKDESFFKWANPLSWFSGRTTRPQATAACFQRKRCRLGHLRPWYQPQTAAVNSRKRNIVAPEALPLPISTPSTSTPRPSRSMAWSPIADSAPAPPAALALRPAYEVRKAYSLNGS